uniref:Uncharacterized protein n=1 Tax=Meloidogyne enterolobii TaxID=390850 RepID=A0A6V7TXD2_MELEN|nr:unnamed protein product [Meloidogyne enterolobii]
MFIFLPFKKYFLSIFIIYISEYINHLAPFKFHLFAHYSNPFCIYYLDLYKRIFKIFS